MLQSWLSTTPGLSLLFSFHPETVLFPFGGVTVHHNICSSGPGIRQTGRKNSLQGSVNQNLYTGLGQGISYNMFWIKFGVLRFWLTLPTSLKQFTPSLPNPRTLTIRPQVVN